MKRQYLILLALILLNSCKDVEVKNPRKTSEKTNVTQKKKISKIVNSAFPLKNIIGIWSVNQNDPHADFEITKEYFYVVDYDGNGEMKYEINDNKIKIHYPDSEVIGLIKKAQNDSLVIYWANGNVTTYTKWLQ